mmetsp:Transcript_12137/g.23928  ORF Transcript_12137/g.23928 Transcript_12137/m.23928 type:complete len:148 (+) Transcript_12137:3-446(+)
MTALSDFPRAIMVKVYGTSEGAPERRETVNVARQLMAVIGIVGLAIVVCVALIASSNMKSERAVMFGIGSGEEQEGANAVYTTFETFKDQEKEVEELLGKEFYVEEFKEAEKTTEKEVEEVEAVVKEAQAEHKVLEIFAKGADAPLK